MGFPEPSRRIHVLLGQLIIDFELARRSLSFHLVDTDIDLAPRDMFLNLQFRDRLLVGQLPGQLNPNIEMAMVDTPRFHVKALALDLEGGSAKPGHTVNHVFLSPS